jgi:hypothetical protein
MSSTSNILEINYMGVTYTFNRNLEDTLEDFHNISWLTAKQMPKTSKEFEKASQLAILWYYQQKYRCEYSSILQKNISDIDLLSVDL